MPPRFFLMQTAWLPALTASANQGRAGSPEPRVPRHTGAVGLLTLMLLSCPGRWQMSPQAGGSPTGTQNTVRSRGIGNRAVSRLTKRPGATLTPSEFFSSSAGIWVWWGREAGPLHGSCRSLGYMEKSRETVLHHAGRTWPEGCAPHYDFAS